MIIREYLKTLSPHCLRLICDACTLPTCGCKCHKPGYQLEDPAESDRIAADEE